MLEIDVLHYPFILTSTPSNYKLGDVMSNFKIWAILSGLDLVLMMMLDSRLTSIFVASILLWSLIFSVREYISKNYSNIFHWIIVIPATIYLFLFWSKYMADSSLCDIWASLWYKCTRYGKG